MLETCNIMSEFSTVFSLKNLLADQPNLPCVGQGAVEYAWCVAAAAAAAAVVDVFYSHICSRNNNPAIVPIHFCSNWWYWSMCLLGCNKDCAVDSSWRYLPQLRHLEAGDYKGSQGSSSSDESIQCTSASASLASANWQWCGVCQVLTCRV